jgi:exopolysaccharide/PEP-CTERM locus tyrosine autokinase
MMQKPANTARRPSLIERAAEAYQLAEQINAQVERQIVEREQSPQEQVAPAPPRSTPPIPGRIAHVDRAELAETGFSLPDAAPTSLGEEFRIVKRQLLLSAMGGQGVEPVRDGRAILISSAEPDEGKTFCAVNLALSLAREKDIEVLLVDADFAKPEVLSTLGIAGGPGLVDALLDSTIDVESCVIRTDLANLSVLPAGRSLNETNELLASEKMRILFEKLLSNPSRIVIFDSSPALAASTSSVLASLVGQTVVVVRADVTGENELREALSLLGACDHMRLLLNAVQLAPHGRRFGAYYGYGA